jgi:phage tail sheath protein FI
MANYTTPGVYIQEIPNLPPSVAQVETAIPAFIGFTAAATMTASGDLNKVPLRIESLVEYQKYFGGADPETAVVVNITTATDGTFTTTASLDESTRKTHMMFYAVQLFYANGGGPCWIVSTGVYGGSPTLPGDLTDGLDAIAREDEPTLIVVPDAQAMLQIDQFLTLQTAALAQCAKLQDRFVIMDVHGANTDHLNDSASDITSIVGSFRDHGTPDDNLMYGAAYAPNIETTLGIAIDETSTMVKINSAAGTAMSAYKTSNTAYYNAAKAAIGNMTLKLPPAGAVAGIYAAVDNARGVWKAPANVTVATAVGPTIAITADEQGTMNVDPTSGKSVNAIRAFAGLGTLVWGARTLAGNDNEWRYVNVRRFCIMVEESIKKATMQFVFEPNDANTWVKVQGMIENFLTTQWRQGALQGVKPEDAFYVSVGLGKTMTADDVLEGRMIVQVGLCPVRPAEFIVLQFIQTLPVS